MPRSNPWECSGLYACSYKCENVQANIEESIHEALTIIAEGYNIKCYRWADIQIDENDKKIEKE